MAPGMRKKACDSSCLPFYYCWIQHPFIRKWNKLKFIFISAKNHFLLERGTRTFLHIGKSVQISTLHKWMRRKTYSKLNRFFKTSHGIRYRCRSFVVLPFAVYFWQREWRGTTTVWEVPKSDIFISWYALSFSIDSIPRWTNWRCWVL